MSVIRSASYSASDMGWLDQLSGVTSDNFDIARSSDPNSWRNDVKYQQSKISSPRCSYEPPFDITYGTEKLFEMGARPFSSPFRISCNFCWVIKHCSSETGFSALS
jgi:hypothetical protein